MTRALISWFGRRRTLMIAGVLLAFAFGGWLSRRTCSHSCPRARARATVVEKSAAVEGPSADQRLECRRKALEKYGQVPKDHCPDDNFRQDPLLGLGL
jgi:polyferredoxin